MLLSSVKPTLLSCGLAAVLIGCLALATPAAAQSGSAKKGSGAKAGSGMKAASIGVGDRAPAVAVTGLDGGSVDLGETLATGKTVLVVLRGYPGYQCGICSRQATGYLNAAQQFADAGLRVVMVYPGGGADLGSANLGDKADEFLGGKTLPAPLTMVLDEDYELTDAYGLRWDAPNETAYPSTFVVDNGVVTWAKVSKTHGGRVSASEALAAATN